MHCVLIQFLVTIVPVREALRNYRFLQHEFSEKTKNHCLEERVVPSRPSLLTGGRDGDL